VLNDYLHHIRAGLGRSLGPRFGRFRQLRELPCRRAHGGVAGWGVSQEGSQGRRSAAAADNAKASWDGPLTEFLAALDPGPAHDWVRQAVG